MADGKVAPKRKAPVKKKASAKRRTSTKLTIQRTSKGICKEIINAFGDIKCKNRNLVIKFLVNLTLNGGNQVQAALEAGLGNATNRADITEEKRVQNAGAEATRLLRNPRIKKAYNFLCEDSDSDEIVRLMTRKDKLISLLFEHALANFNGMSPTVFTRDIELIARLKGYFDNEDPAAAAHALKGIIVTLPKMPQRNVEALKALQEDGFFEDQNIIDGEIIEGEVVGESTERGK